MDPGVPKRDIPGTVTRLLYTVAAFSDHTLLAVRRCILWHGKKSLNRDT